MWNILSQFRFFQKNFPFILKIYFKFIYSLPNSSTNLIITPPTCNSLLTLMVRSTCKSVTRILSSQDPSKGKLWPFVPFIFSILHCLLYFGILFSCSRSGEFSKDTDLLRSVRRSRSNSAGQQQFCCWSQQRFCWWADAVVSARARCGCSLGLPELYSEPRISCVPSFWVVKEDDDSKPPKPQKWGLKKWGTFGFLWFLVEWRTLFENHSESIILQQILVK